MTPPPDPARLTPREARETFRAGPVRDSTYAVP